MKHKVSELSGDLLDAAVALALGLVVVHVPGGLDSAGCFVYITWRYEGDDPRFFGGMRSAPVLNYSRSWEDGGPFIERERIDISAPEEWSDDERWYAGMYQGKDVQHSHMKHEARGATPLIAAMRAYVTSKLGEEVDLP